MHVEDRVAVRMNDVDPTATLQGGILAADDRTTFGITVGFAHWQPACTLATVLSLARIVGCFTCRFSLAGIDASAVNGGCFHACAGITAVSCTAGKQKGGSSGGNGSARKFFCGVHWFLLRWLVFVRVPTPLKNGWMQGICHL